ncbi:MAG: hypothetical protein R3E48_14425 [Burkholderiaceae bacterium]
MGSRGGDVQWQIGRVDPLQIGRRRRLAVAIAPTRPNLRRLEQGAHMLALAQPHRDTRLGLGEMDTVRGECVDECGDRCARSVIDQRAGPIEDHGFQLHAVHLNATHGKDANWTRPR